MVYAKYKYHNRALAPTAKMWASHANFWEFNGSKKIEVQPNEYQNL